MRGILTRFLVLLGLLPAFSVAISVLSKNQIIQAKTDVSVSGLGKEELLELLKKMDQLGGREQLESLKIILKAPQDTQDYDYALDDSDVEFSHQFPIATSSKHFLPSYLDGQESKTRVHHIEPELHLHVPEEKLSYDEAAMLKDFEEIAEQFEKQLVSEHKHESKLGDAALTRLLLDQVEELEKELLAESKTHAHSEEHLVDESHFKDIANWLAHPEEDKDHALPDKMGKILGELFETAKEHDKPAFAKEVLEMLEAAEEVGEESRTRPGHVEEPEKGIFDIFSAHLEELFDAAEEQDKSAFAEEVAEMLVQAEEVGHESRVHHHSEESSHPTLNEASQIDLSLLDQAFPDLSILLDEPVKPAVAEKKGPKKTESEKHLTKLLHQAADQLDKENLQESRTHNPEVIKGIDELILDDLDRSKEARSRGGEGVSGKDDTRGFIRGLAQGDPRGRGQTGGVKTLN